MSSMMHKSTSIRYSETDKLLLKKLSEHLGITQTAVVKMAIRALARKEGISVEHVEKKHI
jgi:predicted DNA-binding protein